MPQLNPEYVMIGVFSLVFSAIAIMAYVGLLAVRGKVFNHTK